MNGGFWQYLLKRGLLGLLTLSVILFSSYALMRLAPGDPTKSSMIGESDASSQLSTEQNTLMRNESLYQKLHLDKPLHIGFLLWLKGVFHGDLGESAAVDKGRPVTELILEKLPVTLNLNLLAICITYILAIPLGIFSAVRPDTKTDHAITFILFFLYSLPVLWTALMLQALFCKGGWLPLFPLKGLVPDIQVGMTTWAILGKTMLHYVLPVFCLSYAGFAGLSRFTRSGMLEVIHQDYIRTARAKGVPETGVIFHHALRNAMIIMITLFAGILPSLVSGSILVEYVFNIPGMGSLSMLALSSRDIPLLMALFAFGGILTLLGILLSDILYVIADPRIDFNSRI
ncbi:MAG: ABC transporter permease [Lentisphaeria bacterium]|nr:ABC transporter permease [Lentisphaeria bacterium]